MAVLTRAPAPLLALGLLAGTCETTGTLELRDDNRCAAGTVGRYTWRSGDDGALRLTAAQTDPCDQPLGGREFVLTAHPWAPAAG